MKTAGCDPRGVKALKKPLVFASALILVLFACFALAPFKGRSASASKPQKLIYGSDSLQNPINEEPISLTVREPEDAAHFFTHALIAFPDIAFHSENPMRADYDRDCLTVKEFKRILEELYANGYALADVYETFAVVGGRAVGRRFLFPADKKPIILSFDDMNYYRAKAGRGMNDKLIENNGRIGAYCERDHTVSFDNENVSILENFIEEHPDFSYNGARGILCLTGFDGILGYRTERESPSREIEISKVSSLVKSLKNKGWRFASHSYGHYHMLEQSEEAFKSYVSKWKREVEPLVGATPIYVYPYGEWDIVDENGKLGAKQKTLLDNGFRFFLGVGGGGFFGNPPWKSPQKRVLMADRRPLDGFSLRYSASRYAPYFDASRVYDSENRYIPF